MSMSDASVMMLIGASGLGCTRSVTLASASLMSSYAVVALVVHKRVQLFLGVAFNRALSRVRISVHRDMNQ